MSDLISRSELLKAMNNWDKFGFDCHGGLVRIDNTNNEEYVPFVPFVHYEDMVNCVNNMPTAYDIDKVVEELESNSFITVKNEEVQTKRKDIQSYIAVEKEVVLLKDAIEIVKQGGASDDVCEWTRSGDMAINPHTFIKYKIKQYDSLYKLDTCQYCRKKIKVVE